MQEENPSLIPVAVTLSILAVLVAIATCWAIGRPPRKSFSQRRPPTSERASRQRIFGFMKWKARRRYLAHCLRPNKEKAEALREKYLKEAERYEKDKDQISEPAKDLEKEREVAGKRGPLIICSLTLLTKKRAFWLSGIVLGLIGLGVTVSGLLHY